jgi:hypothetical protein
MILFTIYEIWPVHIGQRLANNQATNKGGYTGESILINKRRNMLGLLETNKNHLMKSHANLPQS